VDNAACCTGHRVDLATQEVVRRCTGWAKCRANERTSSRETPPPLREGLGWAEALGSLASRITSRHLIEHLRRCCTTGPITHRGRSHRTESSRGCSMDDFGPDGTGAYRILEGCIDQVARVMAASQRPSASAPPNSRRRRGVSRRSSLVIAALAQHVQRRTTSPACRSNAWPGADAAVVPAALALVQCARRPDRVEFIALAFDQRTSVVGMRACRLIAQCRHTCVRLGCCE